MSKGTYTHLKVFRNKVIIEGQLITETALHIGSRKGFDPIESDNPVIKDGRGNPFIPGSSFKGVIRSAMESLLEGLGLNVCHPTEDKYCIEKDKWEEIEEVLNPQKTCLLCKFMGSPYLASKAKFHDMPLMKPCIVQSRDGVAIDRDSLTAAEKKKYDFETVAVGSEFGLKITLDNPENHEMGLLFLTFEMMNKGLFSIGGNTSRGLGRVSINIDKITEWDAQEIIEAFKEKKELKGKEYKKYSEKEGKKPFEEFIKEKIEAFTKWVEENKKEKGGQDVQKTF